MLKFVLAVVPSAGVLFIFWLGIKALVEGDRRERAAQARIEAAERLADRQDSAASPSQRHPAPGLPERPAGSDSGDVG